MEPHKESGLGSLLKEEREKKGLSLDQVVRVTKLRKHFLEALESEDWDKLPSPVYVKGFIRSYANSVGFDGKEAISLYEKIVPVEKEIPTPLIASKVSQKRKIALVCVPIVLAAIALGYYLWPDNRVRLPDNKKPLSVQQENKSKKPKPPAKQVVGAVDREPDSGLEEESKPEQVSTGKDILAPPNKEAPLEPPAGPVLTADDELVLTGIVNMRTYIKIYTDDNSAKEYIFQPGSRPQWSAQKGFDVLVGNAAGIEFDFNGKRTKDLGPLGKVVRVRFPEDFESPIYED